MYFYPLFRTAMKSYIRIFHASPDAPPVDVYANGKLIARNLPYKNFTEYLQVPAGNYNIKVFPTGKTINPVIDTNVTLDPETIYTVAAADTLANLKLIPYVDPIIPKVKNKAYVRFGHLSPNTPNVDITLPDGKILFGDVGFEDLTNYIAVDPGVYTLQARPAGTSEVALTIPNIRFKEDRFYTVYAVGLLGETPPLQVLIPLDGNTYIEF
ncbi:DUF4397 domain-containing protein [Clostridium ganghwense]|uniref:DUF4397 domain-containing protein n=1 Tax=Clostridium ganghwense TaxID=312089 RepID=A0ABT4CS20_9CLOT|nr:DUF4397 domain-containing protein [Clostridium ganghwense]MCY6370876.1 DUF4397 domain-containing protein [Clostridium ganghwense]